MVIYHGKSLLIHGMIWGDKTHYFSVQNPPGFVDVKADDEEALMDAVAQQPVSVAIEADKRAFQNYQSGVLSKSLVRKNGAQKIPCNWKNP